MKGVESCMKYYNKIFNINEIFEGEKSRALDVYLQLGIKL